MRWHDAVASLAVACAACTASAPTTVTVELVDETPTTIIYRDGSGMWLAATSLPGGVHAAHHYDLTVTDSYEVAVAVVSTADKSITAYELLATARDGSGWLLGSTGAAPLAAPAPAAGQLCVDGLEQPGLGYDVSGAMAHLGYVAIANTCVQQGMPGQADGPWPFDIGVLPGVADIVAIDNGLEPEFGDDLPPAIAVWHGLDVTGPIMLPELDPTTTGQSFAGWQFAATNTGASGSGLNLSAQLTLVTAAHTVISLPDAVVAATSTTNATSIVPPSLLATGDLQTVAVTSFDTMTASRTATTTAVQQVGALEFLTPPQLDDVTIALAPVWTLPLDDRTQIVTSAIQASAGGSAVTVTTSATPRWLARSLTPDQLLFDTPPDFDVPSLATAPDVQFVLYLSTTAYADDVLYTSTAPVFDAQPQ